MSSHLVNPEVIIGLARAGGDFQVRGKSTPRKEKRLMGIQVTHNRVSARDTFNHKV